MPNTDPTDLPVVEAATSACRHLRSKGMYVYTDGQANQTHEDYDNTAYWCLKSMTNFGPDDELVGGQECKDPSRTCYEPL
jgi:hypothetical protein